jgi:hypothetical protein
MTLFDEHLAGLPLEIEDYTLDGRELAVAPEFTRVSTTISLRGGGQHGAGEDVTYEEADQRALQAAGAVQPLAGTWTLATFCEHVEGLDLWPEPASREASVQYRIWAYESAALDLALRQAGTSLHAAIGREPAPVQFVNSMRLGDPPTIDPVARRLQTYPGLRFKLDATSDWSDELFDALAQTGAVDSIDLKGLYEGSVVDQGADPQLYRRVAEEFPQAWIEDPKLTPETDAILEPHRDRITWDANIHSVADIEGLPFAPRMVNVKPSRFGPLRELFAAYAHCEQQGIGMYGGGQFELGCGRGHIQYLAAVMHPDTPNDVAPGAYNATDPPAGLPTSPMAPRLRVTGFAWDAD